MLLVVVHDMDSCQKLARALWELGPNPTSLAGDGDLLSFFEPPSSVQCLVVVALPTKAPCSLVATSEDRCFLEHANCFGCRHLACMCAIRPNDAIARTPAL
jgi:hypothetical protein